jgi:hypothetical protein
MTKRLQQISDGLKNLGSSTINRSRKWFTKLPYGVLARKVLPDQPALPIPDMVQP